MELIKRNPLQYYQIMESQLKKDKTFIFSKNYYFFSQKRRFVVFVKK